MTSKQKSAPATAKKAAAKLTAAQKKLAAARKPPVVAVKPKAAKPVEVAKAAATARAAKPVAAAAPAAKSVVSLPLAKSPAAKPAAKGKAAAVIMPGPRAIGLPEDRQSQLKLLIARGKEQGYLTYAQVNDHLPSEIVDPEQIEDIVNTINDMGIPVYEKAPDTESLLASEPSAPADEEAIEEAAAALAALDAELGRTTDPVRMYMREMGTVELLTREGEIRIAKRIEEGLDAVRRALATYPATHEHILHTYELVKAGQARLVDLVVGFIDPNAPDVIAQPQNPTKLEIEAPEENAEEEAEEGDEGEEEAVDTGPHPEEVARRMGSIQKLQLHS